MSAVRFRPCPLVAEGPRSDLRGSFFALKWASFGFDGHLAAPRDGLRERRRKAGRMSPRRLRSYVLWSSFWTCGGVRPPALPCRRTMRSRAAAALSKSMGFGFRTAGYSSPGDSPGMIFGMTKKPGGEREFAYLVLFKHPEISKFEHVTDLTGPGKTGLITMADRFGYGNRRIDLKTRNHDRPSGESRKARAFDAQWQRRGPAPGARLPCRSTRPNAAIRATAGEIPSQAARPKGAQRCPRLSGDRVRKSA